VAKRTREGGEVEVDLMTEVEEQRPRGLRRMSPFGEIGMESELAELGRQTILPSAAVAVTERGFGPGGGDEEAEVEAVAETETETDVVAEDEVEEPIPYVADDEAEDEPADDEG
jgi:hypothetical protein